MDRDQEMTAALDEARRLAGGAMPLARKIGGISRQAVHKWKRCPAHHAIKVEKITGVSRYRLRPDVFANDVISA